MRSLRPAFLALCLVLAVTSSPMATSLALAYCCPRAEACPIAESSCCDSDGACPMDAANASDATGAASATAAAGSCEPRNSGEPRCPLLENAPVEPARTRAADAPALDAHVLSAAAVPVSLCPAHEVIATVALGAPRAATIPTWLELRNLRL